MSDVKKLLESVIQNPSTYTIDVQDGSMLPENLKDKKELSFNVKPPSMGTLARCGILMQELPESLLNLDTEVTTVEVLKHIDKLVKVICIVSHGKETDYPEWYEPFIMQNATSKDVFEVYREVRLKMQTDFFLPCFHIARDGNPMMIHKMKNPNDSILTR